MKKIIYIFILFFSFLTEARIREIRIEGNQLISDAAIRAQIQSQVNQTYRKSKVTQDVKTLFNLGYFNNIYVDLKNTPRGQILTYHVEEKSRVNDIAYEGSEVLSVKKLEELSELKKYEFLNFQKLKSGIYNIKKELKEKGYFLAEVDYKVKPLPQGSIDLVITIREGRKILIKDVSIIGNKNISSSKIKRYLSSKKKGLLSFLTSRSVYSEEKIKRDQQIIRYLYMEEGFLEMNLVDTTLTLAPDQSGLYISFTVLEGEKFTVGQIDYRGDLIFSKVELRENQKLKSGETFIYSRLQNDLTRIRTLYGDKGHAYANVVPQFHTEEGGTIHIVFNVEKGDSVYVREINIFGNDHTRDKVIRRLIFLSEGDLYKASDILKSQSSIQRLGYFENVRFINQSIPGEDDKIDLLVSVEEREKLGEFSGGIGYTSSIGWMPNVKVQRQNLFGYGTSVGVEARGVVSQRQLFFEGFYIDPYFLDSNWYLGIKVSVFRFGEWLDEFIRRSDRNLVVPIQGSEFEGSPFIFEDDNYLDVISYRRFYSNRDGGKFSFGRVFQNKIKILSHFGFENVEFTHTLDPEIFDGSEAGGLRSIVGGSVDYDNRDDSLFPKNGFATNLNFEYTHQNREGLSLLQFTQLDVWGSYYFDLQRVFRGFSNRFRDWNFLREIVVKNKIQYGRLQLLSDEGQIPFDKLYLLGGPTNLRGFDIYSVGEKRESTRVFLRDSDSTLNPIYIPYGGEEQIFYNLEVKFPLVREANIFGILFFDIGYAGDGILSEWRDWGRFRKNVGFGLFLMTPMGPMNLKWGFPFDVRREYGESISEFQFNIGYDF